MRTLLAIRCCILTVSYTTLSSEMLPLLQLSQSNAGFQLFSGVNSICKHLLTKISPQVGR